MLQKILLIIFSLAFIGCASLPEKPKIELCTIDFPAMEGICGTTSNSVRDIKDLEYEKVKDMIKTASDVHRVPLSSLDRGILLMPPEWEKLQNYLGLLLDYAKNRCQNYETNDQFFSRGVHNIPSSSAFGDRQLASP